MPDKTRIRHIGKGFDFLGQNLSKYDGKPLVKPSKKDTHAFLQKIRGLIKANQTVTQMVLIRLFEPGHSWLGHCAAKNTFSRAGQEIWRAL